MNRKPCAPAPFEAQPLQHPGRCSLGGTAILIAAVAAPGIARADVTEKWTRTISVQSTVTVAVAATVGDVTVVGWDRPALSLDIDRSAPSPAMMAKLPVDLTDSPTAVRIAVTQPDEGRDPALRSVIRLRMPRSGALEADVFEGMLKIAELGSRVTAHVRRGRLEAERVRGIIRLETGIGDIRVRDGVLEAGGLLRLRTFNGNADLHLKDRPASARILALTLNGAIASDIALNMKDRAGARFGEATIGSGEPLISIDVVTGNIELKLAGKSRSPSRDGRRRSRNPGDNRGAARAGRSQ